MRFHRTAMHRAINLDFVPDYPVFAAVDRHPYDPAQGINQCYMPPVAAALAAFSAMSATIGGIAITGAMVLEGVMIAGAALSVAGMVTGNETLGWIGAGLGMAGGLGSGLASIGKSMATTAAAEGAGMAANATKAATATQAMGARFPASQAFGAMPNVVPQMAARMPGTIPGAIPGAIPASGVPAPGIAPTVAAAPVAPPVNPMATNPLSPGSAFTPAGQTVVDKWLPTEQNFSAFTAGNKIPGFGTGEAAAGGGGFFNSVGRWVSDNPTGAMIAGTTLASTLAPMIPTNMNKAQTEYYNANAAQSRQATNEAGMRLRWAQGLM